MWGGMDKILRMVWKTVVDDFKSIEPFLVFVINGSEGDLELFRNIFGPDSSPEVLVTNFLAGSGIPCEVEWASIIGSGKLQDVPSPAMLEKPSFRPSMLAWAMTGSPHLPTAGNLQVSSAYTHHIVCPAEIIPDHYIISEWYKACFGRDHGFTIYNRI